MVLNNLLYFINLGNHHKQVRFEVFEDVDYMVIVAEHQGLHLLRSELMKIYQASPSRISDLGNDLLYTNWHILNATGGWLTTGDKDGTKYISIGLPK